ncbi:Fur-regulated basic protein FbpA [Pseudalkalibacillus hwajinpoensis]|uniref:Fur-regulated basic protein FbpA n=1 Tax=Guptibacillus hwajinpoensis TaxID=208199 RepID=UPI00325B9760
MEKERSYRTKEELIVQLLERGIYKVQRKQLYECSHTELIYYYLSITKDSLQVLNTKVST